MVAANSSSNNFATDRMPGASKEPTGAERGTGQGTKRGVLTYQYTEPGRKLLEG